MRAKDLVAQEIALTAAVSPAADSAAGSEDMHAAEWSLIGTTPAAASTAESEDMRIAAGSLLGTAEILNKRAKDLVAQETALAKREAALKQRGMDLLRRVRVKRARRL